MQSAVVVLMDDDDRSTQPRGGRKQKRTSANDSHHDDKSVPSSSSSAATSFFITSKNFITKEFVVDHNEKTLFFFFDRADVTSRHNDDICFKHMRRELKLLLKILCYIAHCYDANVRLIYLEPPLLETSAGSRLTPALRCALTGDFCLAVTFDVTARHESLNVDNLMFMDDVSDDTENIMETLINAVKRLVCVDVNIINSVAAFIMRNDKEKTAAALSMFDWTRWTYAPDSLDKRSIKGMRTYLDKPLSNSNTMMTKNYLIAAIAIYFSGPDYRTSASVVSAVHALNVEEIIDFMFTNMMHPNKNRIYAKFKAMHPDSAAVRIIDEMAESSDRPTTVNVRDGIVFCYSTEHLISKDDFNLYENAPLLRYPVSTSSMETMDDCVEYLISGASNGDTSIMTSDHEVLQDADFGILWPHLHAFKMAADDMTDTDDAMGTLKIKTSLFYNVVVRNANRIVTQPLNGVFTSVKDILSANGVYGFTCAVSKGACFRCRHDVSTVPKKGDYKFLYLVFDKILNLSRCVQAYLSLMHILHTTAPKWKTNRLMLVNHTRGGTGKTHTTNALKMLFHRVKNLFSGFSSLTDTVLKYSAIKVGTVMVMDDVGLSAVQQKNSRKEDALLAAQFKSLLDIGYTNNTTTERDPHTNSFKVVNHMMIYNVAFIWNTNTTDTFSDALQDRCFLLGAEPLSKPLSGRPSCEIEKMINHSRVQQRFEMMFIRQHLFQTVMFTVCKHDAVPSMKLHNFIANAIDTVWRQFPATKNTCSLFRSEFKIMDLVMANAVRLAVSAVFEWWIPPWTIPPSMAPGETCIAYARRLDIARAKAFKCIDIAEAVVEVLAQTKLFAPSAAVEIISINFNQATQGIFATICAILIKALNYNSKETFIKIDTPDGPAVTINHVNRICPEIFVTDKTVVMAGQDVLLKRGNAVLRLVEEVTATSLKLNGFFAMELFKTCNADIFHSVYKNFYDMFKEDLVMYQRMKPIVYKATGAIAIKNFLALWIATGMGKNEDVLPEIYAGCDSDEYTINPSFMGIAAVLCLEDDKENRTAARYGSFDTLSYHTNVNGGAVYAKQLSHTDATLVVHDYVNVQMAWFTPKFIEEQLLNDFAHSRCGILPSGDQFGFYERPRDENDMPTSATDDSPHLTSWEYVEAHAVYQKYLKDVTIRTLDMSIKELTRYICFKNAGESLATTDPYLMALQRQLPSTRTASLEVLNARYNKNTDDIVRLHRDRKRKAAEDTVGNIEVPDGRIVLKKALSVAGMQLLNQMRQTTLR